MQANKGAAVSKMNLDDIKSELNKLSESDRQCVLEEWALNIQSSTQCAPNDIRALNALEFSLLPQIMTRELKQQNITYEEMALQIGVSISTFKRMIAKPSSAKAINLHALLKELGIKVWLEK
ncbi:helix-turn-helix transcriptional regulator [Pantoea endophytica]|uniref:helix-turn-helix transcriptional regulator n=2 Tax=Pantoea TaxID=53335 RepID=UPI003017029D